jgi:hypothetical protein
MPVAPSGLLTLEWFSQGKPWASMKPTLSRPALKLVFFVFFFIFGPSSDNNSPSSLLVLGRCGARYERRNDQTPKTSYSSSAQRSWFKASNGINGRGPPQAGRMPFMPAVSLNQRSGALLTASGSDRFFVDRLFVSVFADSAVQSLAFTSAVRTRASCGARF